MRGLLGGGALALVGVFVGFAFATTTAIAIEGKFWEILTAVGTLLAVFTALAVARRDNARQQLHDRAEAAVIRAQVTPELVLLAFNSADVYIMLGNLLKDVYARVGPSEHARLEFGRWQDRAKLPVCSRLEARFYRLPEGESLALAAILGATFRISEGLEKVCTAIYENGPGLSFFQDDLVRAREELGQVCAHLCFLSDRWPSGLLDEFRSKRLREVADDASKSQ